ncbi:MAG: hypothetical protein A2Y23_02530 [Clostridiales bacterium GWB2_37_7]|nr:MAG: hypothetical protein A2Y23_02530 [Clostridiales bacterium GWB2_37_7]
MKSKNLIYIALLAITLLMFSAFSLDINNGDNITIFDNEVIPSGDIVSGDAVTVFGNLEIKGAVRGDVVAVFGNVDLYGEANGDIVAVFGNVNVHKDAVVGGDAVGVFGSVNREQGAVVRGEVADTKAGFIPKGFDVIPSISFGSVIGMMVVYGLSCLVILILPDRVRQMVHSSQRGIGRLLGIGLLVMLIFILLIPVLMITIIGIIPAILLIFAFMLVALISTTAVYIALGQRIAAAVEGRNAVYIHLLIGFVVVNALGMIPMLGALAAITVFFVGLGVAFDTRVGGLLMRKKAL